MKYKSNQRLRQYSQALRKNMTAQERKLWYRFLKTLPVTVKRQFVIGEFIVDFYCEKAKTAIEIDGSQHYEQSGIDKDKERDKKLNELGIQVIRYTNREIDYTFEAVCNDILNKFKIEEK